MVVSVDRCGAENTVATHHLNPYAKPPVIELFVSREKEATARSLSSVGRTQVGKAQVNAGKAFFRNGKSFP